MLKDSNILRIKDILKEKGMTAKAMAHTLGITENALSMIINGKRQPRFQLLGEIAEYLDVDIKDLFYSTKENDLNPIYKKNADGEDIIVGYLKKLT